MGPRELFSCKAKDILSSKKIAIAGCVAEISKRLSALGKEVSFPFDPPEARSERGGSDPFLPLDISVNKTSSSNSSNSSF